MSAMRVYVRVGCCEGVDGGEQQALAEGVVSQRGVRLCVEIGVELGGHVHDHLSCAAAVLRKSEAASSSPPIRSSNLASALHHHHAAAMPPKKELPVKEKSLFKRLIQEVSTARAQDTACLRCSSAHI